MRRLGAAAQLDVRQSAVVGERKVSCAIEKLAVEEHGARHGTHHPGRRKLAYRGVS